MRTVLGPYHGLAYAFSVECADEVVAGQVERVLRSLEQPRMDDPVTDVARYLFVAPANRRGGLLQCDEEVLLRSRNAWLLYARLLWHINRRAAAATWQCTLLHAAAAEIDGRAVLLPAPMESGKTTLVAGLVRSGMAYLTDEMAALTPSDGRVIPYPKALSVDEGSWLALADLEPDVPAAARHLIAAQWQVPPADIRRDAVSSGARAAFLVLPRYEAGARVRVTRLTPGEAMLTALPQVFHLRRARARDMQVLGAVLAEIPSYELVNGDLDEAVAVVRDLLT